MALFQTPKQDLRNSRLLADRYIVPPFSILNSITSNWQKRKDHWESLGIDSAIGRDVKRNNAMPVNTFSARGADVKIPERLSTFDPVICELAYKWFSLPEYSILDPFAGGSVRGLVANALGRYYTGIDLSAMQVSANYEQLTKFLESFNSDGLTEWFVGDSEYLLDQDIVAERTYDMLFTCPPYYNLERYSTNPDDLSNKKTYVEFLNKYGHILMQSADLLAEDRFAVIVVAEIRNPETGEYYGLVPDTINIMKAAGLKYYNEIILENNIGSLPIRAPKYFDQSRKIGKHHQNILVFYKGNPKNIEKIYGKFEP